MNQLPFETRVRIVSALVEGNSIRAVERQLGVHRDTVMRLGLLAGEACHRFAFDFIGPVHASTIQIDEIWTFIGKKQKRVRYEDPGETGDCYVFIALDADSKLVVSYRTGKRTLETTRALLADVRARVLGMPQITTDGFGSYPAAVGESFGPDVAYGIVEKQYAVTRGNEAAIRYSPGRIRGITKKIVSGVPDEDLMSTSYIERQNLTLRMQLRRFTRLTNAFSKKLRNLEAAVALHFAHYNLCRVHETTRVTPAMASGLTDRVWSVGELLTRALDHGPKAPAPAAPPRRRTLRMIPGGRKK